MNSTYAISVEGLSKQFKIEGFVKKTLLSHFANVFSGVSPKKKIFPIKDISFNIKRGESLGIIGRNGAGKSTLLKLIAGVYKVDQGKVNVDGKLIFLSNLSNGLMPRLSVKDNIFLVGGIMGLSPKEIQQIFHQIIEFSGLKDFVNCKVFQLSNGMRSRLAFSTTILCVEKLNPDIVLLDEVTAGGGDEEFRIKSDKKMREFLDSGKTLVLVSHSLSSIKDLCHEALWLHQGKIMKSGLSKNVVDEYLKSIPNTAKHLSSK